MKNNDIKKSISVWLRLEDGKNQGKFAIQKRSLNNKSFFNICQATWAGKSETNEKIAETIKRECAEELGEEFAKNFDFSTLKLLSKSKYEIKNDDWESYNYEGKINEDLLKMAKLHTEAFPNFIFAGGRDKIYPVSSGKDPQNNIVFFDDQYFAWKKLNEKPLCI
jgi:isopentenyldiphosphate isomerase